MGSLRAVIFDVDGVLVDSYAAHFRSWELLCAEHGITLTEAEFARTFGCTSDQVIADLWGDAVPSEERVSALCDCKEELYREIVAVDFPAIEGAGELVVALHGAGCRLAVGSSGPPENVAIVLDRLEIGGLFDARVTGTDVTRGKPDPQVFQLAAERLGVEPAACVVIEDAPVGVAAARAAGMRVVGLASTGRTIEELAAADLVVDSLRELTAGRVLALPHSTS